MFKAALSERPSLDVRGGNAWHIGNIHEIGDYGGRFAVGRTTFTTIDKYDEVTGNFTELRDDAGPYTYVYFDNRIGLLAIGKRSKLAVDVHTIAERLERLFARTYMVLQYNATVRVDLIPDPRGFLEKISKAFAIKNFRADFTGPNPIDADEVFQKPMSFYCNALNGDQGNVFVRGDNLNHKVVAAVARSTAATGNSASALIQPEIGDRPVRIAFKGDPLKVFVDQDSDIYETLGLIQNAYSEVRR
jgi:hypothetical protein